MADFDKMKIEFWFRTRLGESWNNIEPPPYFKKPDFSAKNFLQEWPQKVVGFRTRISRQGYDPGLPLTFQ